MIFPFRTQNKPAPTALLCLCLLASPAIHADTIPQPDAHPKIWHIGIEASPAFVPATNSYLKGNNNYGKAIHNSFSAAIRSDFSYNPDSYKGIMYKGLYQGIGLDIRTFFATILLGTPVSAYIYQGAPIVKFNKRFWLGYEWKFGAAFGWKHHVKGSNDKNSAVSTPVTAHMGIALKLHYQLSSNIQITLGAEGSHFSNGNTSWPNLGVNSIGASIGLAYTINSHNLQNNAIVTELPTTASQPKWFYDITAYGAWRKRTVTINGIPQLCPGKFGVAGLQFAPMRQLNQWISVGGAIDFQYDESGGLTKYWVEGTTDNNIKFYRPPFHRQINIGLSAHAELTTPIFALNTGFGYDIVCPYGDKRFYQSLTLKTFITRQLYLNTGYRLGNFKNPQNLMLGIGIRL